MDGHITLSVWARRREQGTFSQDEFTQWVEAWPATPRTFWGVCDSMDDALQVAAGYAEGETMESCFMLVGSSHSGSSCEASYHS